MGIPQHGRRKVSVLAADQTLPVFDYKALEGIVKESEFAARKNAKEVAVKIPEDLVGGGEKGYQFSGREGARCGVTLWPAVSAEREKKLTASSLRPYCPRF